MFSVNTVTTKFSLIFKLKLKLLYSCGMEKRRQLTPYGQASMLNEERKTWLL